MLIFSENFKQFVKFFNNSAKITEQKTVLAKTLSNAKILLKFQSKKSFNRNVKKYETKIPLK